VAVAPGTVGHPRMIRRRPSLHSLATTVNSGSRSTDAQCLSQEQGLALGSATASPRLPTRGPVRGGGESGWGTPRMRWGTSAAELSSRRTGHGDVFWGSGGCGTREHPGSSATNGVQAGGGGRRLWPQPRRRERTVWQGGGCIEEEASCCEQQSAKCRSLPRNVTACFVVPRHQ